MSFTFNRTNNKIIKKTVSLTSNPTINTNVFEETYQIVSATNSTINLPNNSNNTNNYYNNWFIRILSGSGINQIRQIQSYNSLNKQLILKTNLEIIPSSSDSIILYNKLNSNIIWQESNNRFAPVYIKNSTNLNRLGETIEYLDFGCNNLTILSNKQSNSTTTGALIVNGGSGISGSVNIGNSLNVNNNISCNSLSVNGISITGNLSNTYLTDITPGTALASKALILNSSKDITGINSLTTTTLISTNLTLNGTSITASAAEINKLTGTMVVTSDFNKLASITASATELNYTNITTIGTAEASKALIVDANKDIISIRNLTATNLTGTLQTASQPNITSVGTLTSLSTGNITLNGTLVTSTATELNYNDITTIGTAQASKALIVDSNKDIQSIRRLHLSNISIGTIDFTNLDRLISAVDNSMTNSTARYLCFGKSYTTYNEAEWGYYHTSDGSTSNRQEFGFSGANGIFAITAGRKVGINKTNPSYDLDVSGDINLTGSIRFSDTAITASAAELNYNDITTIGIAEASKSLIVDANKDIISIRNLTATNLTGTNLTGTIQTSSQPNITSVGTLTSLSTNSLTLNGNTITATAIEINKLTGTNAVTSDFNKLASITASAAELNYNDITNIGIAEESKALIVDTNKDIISIRNLTATNLTGTIQTSSQPNITSVGTLTSLSTNSLTLNGTAITTTATKLNYTDITTIGIAEASKALVTDSNTNISGINNISSVQFNTNSTSTTSINNSTFTGNYDIYLKRSNAINGLSHGISFLTTTNDPLITLPGASILHTRTALSSGHLSFNTTQVERFRITATGNIGINTTNPDRQLEINSSTGNCLRLTNNDSDGSATNFSDLTVSNTGQLTISPSSNNANISNGDILLKGSVIIGKDNSNNILRFNGTTGDANSNMTVISERIYSGTEKSELLLFKGNDIGSTSSGPDRIRLRAAEFRFQTYTSSEDYSGLLDNNDRLFINNNGNIGISTTNPSYTLDVAGDINLTGSLRFSGTSITATAIELNYLDFTTGSPGTAQANKALVLNSTLDITGINSLTTTTLISTNLTLNGTSITASAAEINKLTGTTAVNSDFNKLASITASATEINKLTGTTAVTSDFNKLALITASATELNYNDITTLGTAQASKALIVDANKDIISIRNLSATNLTGTIQTTSQPNITSVGILTSLSTGNITLNGTLITATATELNYVDITTIGIAEANKSLIVDANKDIISIRNLTATNLTGTIQTASQPNITSVGTLTSLTSSGNIISSTANAAFRIVPHTDNIIYLQAGLNTTTGSATDLFIGNYAQATNLSTRKIIFKADGKVGLGTSSPEYTLDVTGDINLTGSLRFSGTSITASAAELNYNDITTIGIAEANKALVVDSNKDIISIRNLTATNLTGTIQTASQTNITTIGTLTGLTSSGQVSITNNTSSTNASTGALIITGGIGSSGNINSGQIIKCGINNTSYNTIGTGGAYFQTGNSTITNSGAASSSTIATSVFSSFARPTLAATNISVTTTNASTIYIENEPLNGTNMTLSNSYALWVNSGKVLLGTGFGSTNKSIATLTINADTLRSNIESDAHGLLISGGNTLVNTCLYMGADNTNSVSYIQSSKVGSNLPLILNNRGGNVGIGLNSPSYTLDVAGDINLTGSLRFSGTTITATAAELNYTDITTIGTAEANKALIVDSNKDIQSIRRLHLSNISIGTSNFSNNARLISAVDNSMTNNTARYLCLGKSYSTYNTAEWGYYHISDGSTTNRQEFGFFGANGIFAITTGRKVGINNISPSYDLDVTGDINLTGSLRFSGTAITATAAEINWLDTTAGSAQASKALVLDINKDISGIRNLSLTGILTVGTVGSGPNIINFSGTTGDANSNHTVIAERIYNNTEQSELLIFKGNDTPNIVAGPDRIRLRAAEFRFQTYTSGEDYSGLNDNNDRLYIHYLGNIGIGTTSPGYTLDVNGSINANSILKSSSYITTDTYFYCAKSSSLSASIICNWGNSYHFGFGYDNTITNTIKVGICDSSGYWSGYANMRCNALYAQGSMSLSVAGYAYFRGDTVTGTVGATTANYSIYANGRIACNGEINVISDYRMKNTIEQLENQYCKDFINNTNPVKFNYNNDQSQKHFGYIAQDVYKAGFTDLVSLCPKEGLDEIIEDDGFINPKDIAFVMSTNELIPILAKNIKIIYNEKKILEDKVINLENENQQLKNQINNIIERLQILENN